MENDLVNIGQNSIMSSYVKSDDILKDMCGIIESSQKAAYQAVNSALVQRNWLIGYRIAEEELQGDNRAEYGASIIKKLAKELTAEYGKGYTKTNLYHFYSFYKTYPEIFHSASGKLLLSWTHYRTLLQVNDKDARDWYEKEALKCFVLIDLKTEKISHADVGQMDMYIRMYDELKRGEGDNPTIGIRRLITPTIVL